MPNTSVEVEPFVQAVGVDLGMAFALISDGAARGWMRDWSSMGSPCAVLTIEGLRVAQRRMKASERLLSGRWRSYARSSSSPTRTAVVLDALLVE
jgi:hypothetical protein